jgi:hypothetical protein
VQGAGWRVHKPHLHCRWRAWRKTADASHDFSNPGMTDKERKAAKKIALAADTAKCAQRALLVSPAATEPLILKAWALVTAGNSTAATNFCISQLSQNGTKSSVRSKRGGGGGLGGVQAAAELWLIHGRSLCLDGDPILARSVLQRAIQVLKTYSEPRLLSRMQISRFLLNDSRALKTDRILSYSC